MLQNVAGINAEWNVLARVKFTVDILGKAVDAFYEGDVHLPGNNAESDEDTSGEDSSSDDESDTKVAVPSRQKPSRNFGTIAGSDDDEDGRDEDDEGEGGEDDANEPSLEVVEFTGAGSLCVGPAGRELVRGCFENACFKDCSPTMGATV